MPLANAKSEELVIVERRRNTRIIVSVPGIYMLADHRNSRGERRTYPCRAVNLAPETIALVAPVCGRLGERAFVTIDHIGKFKGSIIRLLDGGFVMSIVATDEERNKFAAKIDWFEQFKNFDITDQRADARFVPENPRSRIVFCRWTLGGMFHPRPVGVGRRDLGADHSGDRQRARAGHRRGAGGAPFRRRLCRALRREAGRAAARDPPQSRYDRLYAWNNPGAA